MTLTESLKFVKSGYAKTDLVPELTHFVIKDRRIIAYNGEFGISCPIALDFDIAPHAGHFYKCVDACGDKEISLTSEKGSLRVKSGGFKALISCIDTHKVPFLFPRGSYYKQPQGVEILPILKNFLKILETNNPKEFANGILFDTGKAYVTNGKVLVQADLGLVNLPKVNVPKKALVELVRNDEEPLGFMVDQSMLYFILPDEKWMATKTLVTQWPNLAPILGAECQPVAPPPGFWEALATLGKMTEESGAIYFLGDSVATHRQPEKDSASVECPGLLNKGVYSIKEFLRIKELAERIDFTLYPGPAMFESDKIKGAIVGMTQ